MQRLQPSLLQACQIAEQPVPTCAWDSPPAASPSPSSIPPCNAWSMPLAAAHCSPNAAGCLAGIHCRLLVWGILRYKPPGTGLPCLRWPLMALFDITTGVPPLLQLGVECCAGGWAVHALRPAWFAPTRKLLMPLLLKRHAFADSAHSCCCLLRC